VAELKIRFGVKMFAERSMDRIVRTTITKDADGENPGG